MDQILRLLVRVADSDRRGSENVLLQGHRMKNLVIPISASVLVVDDDIARRHFFLSTHRLPQAYIAGEPDQAIQILKQGSIDFVFLDYDLASNLSSEPVARYLAETKSETETQVFIDSTNPFGIEVLKRILPNATVVPFGSFEIRRVRS